MTTLTEPQDLKRPLRRIPGEEGTWIFILGDMCVFAVFFTVYLVNFGANKDVFVSSQATLNQNFGAINTIFLLISSLFVVLAVRAVQDPRYKDRAPHFISMAMMCGLAFIVVKAFEYHQEIDAGHTPAHNDFYMYYFILTGLHLFHLVVGMVVLIALRALARKPELSKNQWSFFEGGGCFWHMVDLLWIVLFPLIFLVR